MPGPEVRFWGLGALACAYALVFLFRYFSFGPLSLTELIVWSLLPLFPLACSVEALQEFNGLRRLRAGQDVIARWVVTPADWERFRAFDSARSARYSSPAWLRSVKGGVPIEIIIGARELMVGGRWQKLQGHVGSIFHVAWIEVEPACLEIAILGGADPLSFGVVRVPVPANATSAGRRVLAHFKSLIPGTAEPPRFLFGYDMAEGAAERYVPSTSPRDPAKGNVRIWTGAAFFALVGVGMALLAGYQGRVGMMDLGGAQLMILVGLVTAGAVLGAAAILHARSR